ncbi:MAG: hypothetical protein ACI4RG_04005 [Huintestinicola sp.]
MEKFRNRFIAFMYGRNGPDRLYKASVAVFMVLAFINIFVHSVILGVLSWALFFWTMFRCFSKNVYKRSLENQAYLRLEEKVIKKFGMTKTILTDKEHCYKKCRRCKAYLRLPRKSGTHTALCPKCGEKITIKIR